MRNIRCSEEFVDQIANTVAENLYDPWSCKLADPDAISIHKLEDERILWVPDCVDDNFAVIQRKIILWNMQDYGLEPEQRRPIKLVLFNYGGDAERCCSIVDTIFASKTPVWTVNLGVAASAGSYIFLAGSRRFMLKRAYTLLHEGSAQMSGDANKMENQQIAYKKLLKDWHDYVLQRTTIPETTFKKHKTDDWFLYADDCMKYNIATDIIETLDDVFGEDA